MKIETFEIPDRNFYKLEKVITKLNKVAKKLDLKSIVVNEIKVIKKYKTNEITGFKKYYKVHVVEITGEAPIIEGWKFLARINHDKDTGQTFVDLCPGVETIPVEYFSADHRQCDHCHTRRQRNDVYVVQNIESGEHRQVGRNCLIDFIGHIDPKALASFLETYRSIVKMSNDDEDDTSFGGGQSFTYEVKDLLAATSAIVRKHGWTPSKAAFDGVPTYVDVQNFVQPPPSLRDWANSIVIDELDKTVATEAIEYISALDPKGNSYIHNIKTIAETGIVSWRRFSVAVSILPFYNRIKEQKAKASVDVKNEWAGEVGDVFNSEVKVTFVKFQPSNYGYNGGGSYVIYKFADKDGRTVVWFSSNDLKVNIGDAVTIKGKIKKLDEYNGIKQTTITRAKMI